MSLHIISGLPRNGKSFYCVTRMIDDLTETERCIYTNLPLNPDYMARIVALRKCSKSVAYLDYLDDILSRIRIFRKFNNRKELEDWRNKNPLWCRIHSRRNRANDDFPISSRRLLYTFEELSDYWNHSRANSLFYIDECYQIWNCMDASDRTAGNKERRKELQNYMRMHGHDADDIFLISHKERDLDKFILDTCSYRINVKNSKYWPIVPQEIIDKYWWISFMGSLRWPVQFFILRTFIGDEATHHKTFWRRSDRRIFKCYDSMSRPNGLRDRGYDSSAKSSDIGTSFFKELRSWFWDALPSLVILFCAAIFVHSVYTGLRSMLKPSEKPVAISSAGDSTVSSASGTVAPFVAPVPVVIRSITPQSIYFSNSVVLRVGGKYEFQGISFDVISVSRDFVELRAPSGKLIKVTPGGLFK